MRNRLTVLILLFAFGCGLLAGPHPCHARRVAPSPGGEAKMACHSQAPASQRSAGPSLSAAKSEDCCARHGVLCESACQTVGVVRVEIPRFAIQPLAGMAAPAVDRSLPLFAHAIDHVPLA